MNGRLLPLAFLAISSTAFSINASDLPKALLDPKSLKPTYTEEEYDATYTFQYEKFFWGEDVVVVINKIDGKERAIYISTSNIDKYAPKRKLLASFQNPKDYSERYNLFIVSDGGFKGNYLVESFDGEETSGIVISTPTYGTKEVQSVTKKKTPGVSIHAFPAYQWINNKTKFCKSTGIKCNQI